MIPVHAVKLLHGEAYEIIFGGSCCGKRPISGSLACARVYTCCKYIPRQILSRTALQFIHLYEANIFLHKIIDKIIDKIIQILLFVLELCISCKYILYIFIYIFFR